MWDIVAAQLAVLRAQVGGLQAQVGGLQAQIDVLQAVVDEQAAVTEAAATAVCQHENREDDGSTLTEQRERCLNCGAMLIDGKAA